MESFIIEGGRPLSGNIKIQGAKNAALPILAASLLAEGIHQIDDIPQLLDIDVMVQILAKLGVNVNQEQHTISLDTRSIISTEVPEELMSQMRSSIFLMGPLLARFHEVTVFRPGGCAIGERKIDLHLKGLEALGAKIEELENRIVCRTDRLQGATIVLDYPSVGATENIMMAATRAKGITKIIHAAKEPEIVDLQNFLNMMGARVSGAGTEVITIEGVDRLHSVPYYQIIPDRIAAATFMAAVGMTGGKIALKNVIPAHLSKVIEYLQYVGIEFENDNDKMIVTRENRRLKAVKRILTSPYPGFPTDMQAQFMALLSLADGVSMIEETVFDSRYKHVKQLISMGAKIEIEGRAAIIQGTDRLFGTEVRASDLRAGAALVLAGMAAEGKTTVRDIYHIDRGYENLEAILQSLGANIERIKTF
ncbi:UDP-N-acetylglucosamine 1-carboxyvinyltransferase [Tepidibacillus fermentans]|uniref:UDP-N-acetylglucosamine 1-carboxyvinyltransferase n=1 Tax=Tepidibacillus fermentans TaxID=1281767 RepID=A0A4R3KKJ5_9BACI|nr:UDP-N-acetylglucosamine 1-carboxyvinyltransferase [Tepidibacillus fermentans]TCS84411.1 UDP-N-acetylglucosamine 1-carboxyvinyltransferase [Tepidibacillus fermentans]